MIPFTVAFFQYRCFFASPERPRAAVLGVDCNILSSKKVWTGSILQLIQFYHRQLASVGPLMEGNNWKVFEACATALNCSEGIVEECIKNAKVRCTVVCNKVP